MMRELRPRAENWTPNPDPSSLVVPGVDATASVNEQIDQMDQLITIRLQNIDANFSRIQHVISTKLLPAFKRYAEGTAPVREAAKFWKSFYETAAQVHIPLAGDTSSLYRTEDDNSERDTSVEVEHNHHRTFVNVNPRDDSFVRDGLVSSTPLVRDPAKVALPRDPDDSWAASIESPFERLGRQVKDLTLQEADNIIADPSTSYAPSFSPMHGSYTGVLPHSTSSQIPSSFTPSNPTSQVSNSRRKGKSPLRQNVLRQNAEIAAASNTSTPPQPLHTPRRVKTPKNPFIPPNSVSRQWNGLVDLRQASSSRAKASRAFHAPENSASTKDADYDSDSSDDLFPPGMSPPVTIQFAMPSRVQRSSVKLALTPARRAAERISRDLVANVARRGADAGSVRRLLSSDQRVRGDPSLSSVAPSLPSLTKYSGHPTVLPPLATTSTLERLQVQSNGETVTTVHQGNYRDTRGLMTSGEIQNSPDSDSDSKSPEHNESNPSAAFLFATQNNARDRADDSFASSQQSLSDDGDEEARVGRHALAHIFVSDNQDGGAEDSFDQDASFAGVGEEEDTVFGARQVGQQPRETRLRIMRDALIDDMYPGAPSLNPFAQVEHSPSPYTGEAEELL